MIKKSAQMRTETRSGIRGGNGDIKLLHIFEAEEMLDKSQFFAHMHIPVGGSVGKHVHDSDIGILLIMKGVALVDDNGTACTLSAGDAMFTGSGEYHSIANAGDIPLEIIGIVLK